MSSPQVNLKPYLSSQEVIGLTKVLDMDGMNHLHELVMIEELAGTYTKQELDRIWCALIDRFDKLERLDEMLSAFSLN